MRSDRLDIAARPIIETLTGEQAEPVDLADGSSGYMSPVRVGFPLETIHRSRLSELVSSSEPRALVLRCQQYNDDGVLVPVQHWFPNAKFIEITERQVGFDRRTEMRKYLWFEAHLSDKYGVCGKMDLAESP